VQRRKGRERVRKSKGTIVKAAEAAKAATRSKSKREVNKKVRGNRK
jgi:hypothetical protein